MYLMTPILPEMRKSILCVQEAILLHITGIACNKAAYGK